MGNIVRDKLRVDLAESIRWAERAKFWRDFCRFTKEFFARGFIYGCMFRAGIDLAANNWIMAVRLSLWLCVASVIGICAAWQIRRKTRRKVLFDRAARVGLVRRSRESSASFERRIALQEQMADLP